MLIREKQINKTGVKGQLGKQKQALLSMQGT